MLINLLKVVNFSHKIFYKNFLPCNGKYVKVYLKIKNSSIRVFSNKFFFVLLGYVRVNCF